MYVKSLYVYINCSELPKQFANEDTTPFLKFSEQHLKFNKTCKL